jgi:hypothetical protein
MKSRYTTFPVTNTYSILNKNDGSSFSTVYRSVGGYDHLAVMQDTISPVNRKELHNHEFRKTIRSDFLGSVLQEDSVYYSVTSGVILSFDQVDPPSLNFSYLYNEALTQVLDELRSGGVGSGLDLSVDVLEARQTAKMAKDANALVRQYGNYSAEAWAAFHRGTKNRSWAEKVEKGTVKYQRLLKRFGVIWLTWQYGIKPLMNSLWGTFDALMHRRIHSYVRLKGKSREMFWYEKIVPIVPPGIRCKVDRNFRSRCLMVCEYRLPPSTQQQLLGYTSLNPAVIAWELLPLSFVADWVINIGGYLRALEGASAYQQNFVRGYCVMGYLDAQQAVLGGSNGSVLQNNFLNMSGRAYQRMAYKYRFVLSTQPFPMVPTFHVNLGWQRLLSAASLLSLGLAKGDVLERVRK